MEIEFINHQGISAERGQIGIHLFGGEAFGIFADDKFRHRIKIGELVHIGLEFRPAGIVIVHSTAG